MSGGLRGLLVVFLASTVSLLLLVFLAPQVDNRLRFPDDVKQLICLADEVLVYRHKHPVWSVLLLSATYVYIQTFAVPGSFVLNLLCGAVFGPYWGSLLACLSTTTGSSFCFLLSSIFAKELVHKLIPKRLSRLRRKINGNQRQTALLLLSARIFPFTPHWLIHICSPFVGISLRLHCLTVLVGLLPYNVLCARAGAVLFELRAWEDVLSPTVILNLLVIAAALLGLSCARRKRDEETLPSRHDKPRE